MSAVMPGKRLKVAERREVQRLETVIGHGSCSPTLVSMAAKQGVNDIAIAIGAGHTLVCVELAQASLPEDVAPIDHYVDSDIYQWGEVRGFERIESK